MIGQNINVTNLWIQNPINIDQVQHPWTLCPIELYWSCPPAEIMTFSNVNATYLSPTLSSKGYDHEQ